MGISALNSIYRRTIFLALSMVGVTLIYCLLFLWLMDKGSFTFLDSLYWVISTMTTVGYGDIVFTTQGGKLFSIVVELTGILFIFGLAVPFILIPWIEGRMYLRLPIASGRMKNHIVICGFSEFIEELLIELEDSSYGFVVVEDTREKVKELREKGINCIYGDYSSQTFENVRLEKADSLLCSHPQEEKNAEILLSAREYSIPKVAIVEDPSYSKFLTYAGATKVLSVKGILGVHLARKSTEAIRHELTSALEIAKGIEMAEVFLTPRSWLVGRTLEESDLENLSGATVLGLWRDGEFLFNPPGDEPLKSNSVILAVGRKRHLNRLLDMAVGI